MIIKRELYFKEVQVGEFYRVISAIQDFFYNMKNEDDLNHFQGNTNILTDIVINNLFIELDKVLIRYENLIDYIKEKEIGKVVFKEIEANNFGFVDIQGVLIYENGESVNIFSRVSNVGWNFFCDDEEIEKKFLEGN